MATFNAGITSASIVNDGGFYTTVPSVAVNGGGGNGASLTAVISVGGSGYTSVPTVVIEGSQYSTYAATATATVSNGVVTGVSITSGGLYGGAPTIRFTGSDGSGAVAKAVMTTHSSGYQTISSIVLGSPVTSITINSAGSNYLIHQHCHLQQDMEESQQETQHLLRLL